MGSNPLKHQMSELLNYLWSNNILKKHVHIELEPYGRPDRIHEVEGLNDIKYWINEN